MRAISPSRFLKFADVFWETYLFFIAIAIAILWLNLIEIKFILTIK